MIETFLSDTLKVDINGGTWERLIKVGNKKL